MNTQLGPVCPRCKTRTLQIAGIPGGWCRCPNCRHVVRRKPPVLDNMPGRPTPVAPVPKIVGRLELAWCPTCGRGTSTTSGEHGRGWYCHECRLEFEDLEDGLIGYGRPEKNAARSEGRGPRHYVRKRCRKSV